MRWVALLFLVCGCDLVFTLDRPAPDGGTSDAADAPTDTPNIAFVTSQRVAVGSLGGSDGADAVCQQLAADAGLTGTYVAWVSTTTQSARGHVEANNPRGWVRRDGLPFADTVDDIANLSTFYPLRITEGDDDIGLATDDRELDVATGSRPDGTLAAGNNCLDFGGSVGT